MRRERADEWSAAIHGGAAAGFSDREGIAVDAVLVSARVGEIRLDSFRGCSGGRSGLLWPGA